MATEPITELELIDNHIRRKWNLINLTYKEGSQDYIKALETIVYYYKKREQLNLKQK